MQTVGYKQAGYGPLIGLHLVAEDTPDHRSDRIVCGLKCTEYRVPGIFHPANQMGSLCTFSAAVDAFHGYENRGMRRRHSIQELGLGNKDKKLPLARKPDAHFAP
jgi:hypothetical protein